MTAVHQFVPALLPRDATGDHTLALRETFRAAGWESDIYVEAAHDELLGEATYFEQYPDHAKPGDILLYQLSTGSPVAEFLAARPETLVLDYHNITPASFYEGWEEHTADKVALARHQVAELAPKATLGIADSAFNAAELRGFGCPETTVVPILCDIAAWSGQPDPVEAARLAARRRGGTSPVPGTSSDAATGLGIRTDSGTGTGTVLLFVGRLSPNKAQHQLVEALWFYRRWYDPEARLRLVGPATTKSYAEAVLSFAAELGLADAVERGERLTQAELAAWYADADLFVCLSDHEGFCIPLLEAMHFDLPIVAFGAGAVPETLGQAGVLLDTKRPSVVAAAIDRVRNDTELAARLAAAGHDRLETFAIPNTRARFIEVLGALDQRQAVTA